MLKLQESGELNNLLCNYTIPVYDNYVLEYLYYLIPEREPLFTRSGIVGKGLSGSTLIYTSSVELHAHMQ